MTKTAQMALAQLVRLELSLQASPIENLGKLFLILTAGGSNNHRSEKTNEERT